MFLWAVGDLNLNQGVSIFTIYHLSHSPLGKSRASTRWCITYTCARLLQAHLLIRLYSSVVGQDLVKPVKVKSTRFFSPLRPSRVKELSEQLQTTEDKGRVEREALLGHLHGLTSDGTAAKLENQSLKVPRASGNKAAPHTDPLTHCRHTESLVLTDAEYHTG